MSAIKPPRLRKGDLIGLVSPASAVRPLEKVERAVRYLESHGYRVSVGANARKEHGFLAATDHERLSDLNGMIRDRRVKAVFATRGGYGSGRLLAKIDYAALRRTPKIIAGFSDLTALQLAVFKKCRLVTFSGPMPAVEFWQGIDPYTEENFWRLLTSAAKPGTLRNPPDSVAVCVRPGSAAGILLGGNLSLVVSILGTPFSPAFRNTILVLEEVDEAPYRVDRMLTQIRNTGAALKGAILGQFTRCEPKSPTSFKVDEVIADFCHFAQVPAISGFQYGHVPRKLTVPFGVQARLKAEALEIQLLEAAVV